MRATAFQTPEEGAEDVICAAQEPSRPEVEAGSGSVGFRQKHQCAQRGVGQANVRSGSTAGTIASVVQAS